MNKEMSDESTTEISNTSEECKESLQSNQSKNTSVKTTKKEPVYHPRALAKWAELERRGFIQKTK